jgi:hypothetical protein
MGELEAHAVMRVTPAMLVTPGVAEAAAEAAEAVRGSLSGNPAAQAQAIQAMGDREALALTVSLSTELRVTPVMRARQVITVIPERAQTQVPQATPAMRAQTETQVLQAQTVTVRQTAMRATPEARALMVTPEIRVMRGVVQTLVGPRRTLGPDKTGPTETQVIQVPQVRALIQVQPEVPAIRGPTAMRAIQVPPEAEPEVGVPHQTLGPAKTARTAMPEIQGRQARELQAGALPQTLGPVKTVQTVMPETRAQQVRVRQTAARLRVIGPVSLERMVTPAMLEQTALEPPPVIRAVQATPE